MVTIKFFGSIRVNHNIENMSLREGTIKQIINDIIKTYPSIEKKQLLNSIIMINDVPLVKLNRLMIQLKKDDELVFLSPVAGG